MNIWPAVANIAMHVQFEKCTRGAKDPTGWIRTPFHHLLWFPMHSLDVCLRKREGSFRFSISSLPYLWPFKRIFLMFAKKDKTKKHFFDLGKSFVWHTISGLISAKKFEKWWERWLLLGTYIMPGIVRQ